MQVTDPLREEHQIILGVLGSFEAMLQRTRRTDRVEEVEVAAFLGFFREFADRCHHAKEEEVLFPALERAGVSARFGPLAVMHEEHEQGRELVETMRSLLAPAGEGSAVARDALLRRGEALVGLLRSHIDKEDHCLFPMVEERLDDEEARTVLEAYRQAGAGRR